MQDATGDSTLEAKNAFERDCMTRNVVPKNYHADNGQFAENSLKQDCVAQTFVTVTAGVLECTLQAQPSSVHNYVKATEDGYSSSPISETKK